MHATVKRLRQIIKGVEGAWVRRWQDGELWVGTTSHFSEDLRALHQRLSQHDSGFRVVGVAGPRSWLVEQR